MNDNIKKIIEKLDEKYGFISPSKSEWLEDLGCMTSRYSLKRGNYIDIGFEFNIIEIDKVDRKEYFIFGRSNILLEMKNKNFYFQSSSRSLAKGISGIEKLQNTVFFDDGDDQMILLFKSVKECCSWLMDGFANIFPDAYEKYLGR